LEEMPAAWGKQLGGESTLVQVADPQGLENGRDAIK